MDKLTYASSGVSIDEGNKAVELMKQKVSSTYIDGVVGELGLFSGGFSLGAFKDMEEPVLLAATDGVGTKLLLAQQMDIHSSVGQDLVAMCVNDLICQGARPLFFLDYIATGKVKAEKIADIVGGIADACKLSGCALIGGETAEMPDMYQEEDYDLAGFAVGIADRKKMIDGSGVQSGDVLIGLSSSGFHSNGYSLVRKLFFDTLGLGKEDRIPGTSLKVGETLLTPTKLYVSLVMDLLRKHDIKGIAHITGGGLTENVPRVIPGGFHAFIDRNSWEMPEIFRYVLSLDKIEESELYRSFNMGIGMVLVVSKDQEREVLKSIAGHPDHRAFVIGEIGRSDSEAEASKVVYR
ncbi:MAG: phosphoribosylformylglycinamidine cyclo-ligase [Peptostreptococcaceae bacterium]|nr:phosphoribosylformylglycinamidine cyclo-ligase [Peptostreptococcaceae bacterium]